MSKANPTLAAGRWPLAADISIALPKGRLAEKTFARLVDAGLTEACAIDFSSRRLVFTDERNRLKFLLIRSLDVPTYVEHGGADLGVVGKDVLEETASGIYEFCDLGYGKCRLSVAAPKGFHTYYSHNIRIATKYPNLTKNIFAAKGIFVEIIKLYGSVEIAPLVGLSDYIVDLVETGATLKENGLEEVETLMESTARLVANPGLARLKHERIKSILTAFRTVEQS